MSYRGPPEWRWVLDDPAAVERSWLGKGTYWLRSPIAWGTDSYCHVLWVSDKEILVWKDRDIVVLNPAEYAKLPMDERLRMLETLYKLGAL